MNPLATFYTNVRHIHLLTSALLLAGLCGTHIAQAQVHYSYSVDGSEVADSKTGLVWRRCSEGQSWGSGTCNGTAATYTQLQALEQAKTQTGWRLPNVNELSSITNVNESSSITKKTPNNPAINVTAFPATPSSYYWSASPYAGAPRAWCVSFGNGHADTGDVRDDHYHVRLVRNPCAMERVWVVGK